MFKIGQRVRVTEGAPYCWLPAAKSAWLTTNGCWPIPVHSQGLTEMSGQAFDGSEQRQLMTWWLILAMAFLALAVMWGLTERRKSPGPSLSPVKYRPSLVKSQSSLLRSPPSVNLIAQVKAVTIPFWAGWDYPMPITAAKVPQGTEGGRPAALRAGIAAPSRRRGLPPEVSSRSSLPRPTPGSPCSPRAGRTNERADPLFLR